MDYHRDVTVVSKGEKPRLVRYKVATWEVSPRLHRGVVRFIVESEEKVVDATE